MAAKKRKKRKSSPLRIVLGTFLILFLLIFLFVFLFIESKLNLIDYDTGSDQPPVALDASGGGPALDESLFEGEPQLDISGLEPVAELKLPTRAVKKSSDVLNILLLGTDERTTEFNYASRSDAIMLVSLNFSEHTGKLVSFERGMGVLILDGEYQGKYDWITHCFRYGGADLMLREIRELFRVDVDHYVRINFNALIKLVDAVGGVDLTFTAKETDYLNNLAGIAAEEGGYGENGELPQFVTEGFNHVNGATALNYARCRHIDSDWQRIGRQRNLVQAFVNQVKTSDLKTLNKLADTLLPMVRTNFTRMEILTLMTKAPGMLGLTFGQMTIPAEGTYGFMPIMNDNYGFAPDLEKNAEILEQFLYG